MTNSIIRCFAIRCLLVFAAGLIGCDDTADMHTGRTASVGGGHFTLGVEQDGRRIPIVNNQVTIEKKPFRMVFWFDQLGSMLVHASYEPNLVERARNREPLETLFPPAGGYAEELMNPDQAIFLGNGGYHNWLCLGEKMHRFDAGECRQIEDGGFLCRRTVANFVDVKTGRTIPIERCPAETLYFVIARTERAGTGRRQELQRDWLEIHFK